MAQQLARAHRARQAPPSVQSLDPLRPVTLEDPRPHRDRANNLYVETPHRPPPPPTPPSRPPITKQPTRSSASGVGGATSGPSRPPVTTQPISISSTSPVASDFRLPPVASAALFSSSNNSEKSSDVVTQKPLELVSGAHTERLKRVSENVTERLKPLEHHHHHHTSTFKSTKAFHPIVSHGPATVFPERSIMCPVCGQCRCHQCQMPKQLPSRWVCHNRCLCSADAIIDYASCLCCVKGLFYHCSETDGGESCADNPCNCGPDRRSTRWACLAALSIFLPCLFCYLPLQGCKKVVEMCYAKHSRQGCRCRPPVPMPEKRLLDSSGDF